MAKSRDTGSNELRGKNLGLKQLETVVEAVKTSTETI